MIYHIIIYYTILTTVCYVTAYYIIKVILIDLRRV